MSGTSPSASSRQANFSGNPHYIKQCQNDHHKPTAFQATVYQGDNVIGGAPIVSKVTLFKDPVSLITFSRCQDTVQGQSDDWHVIQQMVETFIRTCQEVLETVKELTGHSFPKLDDKYNVISHLNDVLVKNNKVTDKGSPAEVTLFTRAYMSNDGFQMAKPQLDGRLLPTRTIIEHFMVSLTAEVSIEFTPLAIECETRKTLEKVHEGAVNKLTNSHIIRCQHMKDVHNNLTKKNEDLERKLKEAIEQNEDLQTNLKEAREQLKEAREENEDLQTKLRDAKEQNGLRQNRGIQFQENEDAQKLFKCARRRQLPDNAGPDALPQPQPKPKPDASQEPQQKPKPDASQEPQPKRLDELRKYGKQFRTPDKFISAARKYFHVLKEDNRFDIKNPGHFMFWKKSGVKEYLVVYASRWTSNDGEEHLMYVPVENRAYFGERDSMPLGDEDSMPLGDEDRPKKKAKKN